MDLTLVAQVGRTKGSRPSGRLRETGYVPGVVYGLGQDAVEVSVEHAELRRVLTSEAGLNALITLDYEGQRDLTIVKDLQRHPVRRDVLHVDFLRVDPDAEVTVDVQVILLGEAKAVENMRGIVEQQLKTLPVKAKPREIPRQLEIDITDLEVGSSVTVADVALPEGSTTELDPESPVVSGVATRFTVLAQKGLSGAEMDAAADAADAAGDTGTLREVAAEADATDAG
jgi:large subunit ribosomal protein L25